MPAVGELVRCTDGRWMIRPPQHCQRGHRLAPGRVLFGHVPCSCRGGHTTWACLRCGGLCPAAVGSMSGADRPRGGAVTSRVVGRQLRRGHDITSGARTVFRAMAARRPYPGSTPWSHRGASLTLGCWRVLAEIPAPSNSTTSCWTHNRQPSTQPEQ
jgi:hypothetical protein